MPMLTCRTCTALCSEITVTAARYLLTMCAPAALLSYFLGGASWGVLQFSLTVLSDTPGLGKVE